MDSSKKQPKRLSTSSLEPLPPPPSLPPSMLVSLSKKSSSTSSSSSISTTKTALMPPPPPPPPPLNVPLPPPPPPLNTTATKNHNPLPTETTNTGISTMTTSSSSSKPLPPPPPPLEISASSVPPPPPPRPNAAAAAASELSSVETVKKNHHETVKQIPKLPSAPNSGAVPTLDDEKHLQEATATATATASTREEEQEYVPRDVDVLAQPRQCWIPIWIVATEEAQKLSQKHYHTELHSLWTHLLQTSASSYGASSSSTSTQQNFPFRSIQGRHISFSWKQLASRIHFLNANHIRPCTDDEAQQIFHTSAKTSSNIQQKKSTKTKHNNNTTNHTTTTTTLEQEIPKLLSQPPIINIPYSQRQSEEDDDNHTTHHEDDNDNYEHVEKAHEFTSTIANSPNHWLSRYRMALDLTTQYLPHDVIHVPPVIIFVGTSKEGVAALQQMSNNANNYFLPSPIQTGEWDYSTIQKEYLLLLDSELSADTNIRIESQLLQQMYSIWNASCCNVLTLYSSTSLTTPDQRQTEQMTVLPTSSSDYPIQSTTQPIIIANSDKIAMRRYLTQIISTSMLPSLERRIATLNVAVTNAKKGVKNMLKGFWKSTGTSSSSSSSTNNYYNNSKHGGKSSLLMEKKKVYKYDSIETQTRFLADTLFLLMDYEAALTIYKLVKDDYKHDKNYLQYASIHEMMTLCYYYMGKQHQQRHYTTSINIYASNILHHLETALYAYTTTATSVGTRCATRLCMVLATMMDKNPNYTTDMNELEIADLMASASSHESPLGAAVLLELASHYYYCAKMYRKFAFHMLMAGHMYRSSDQEQHATRCFISSIYYYHHTRLHHNNIQDDCVGNGRWNELYHHLVSALASQLYATGQYSYSMPLYKLLLGTLNAGRVSVKSQIKFVTHFQDVCIHQQNTPSTDEESKTNSNSIMEVTDMNLPTIVDKSISVEVQPFSTNKYSNNSHTSLGLEAPGEEGVWKELMCSATAECKVGNKIIDGDIWTEQVIEKMDQEKTNEFFLVKKSKNLANVKPIVRARNEPLVVSFVIKNPLGIPIPIRNMQLVAKLTHTFTNDEGKNVVISTTNSKAISQHKKNEKVWRFSNSELAYVEADFSITTAPTPNATQDPLFVVTKQNITLAALCEKYIVSLGITPLTMGDLEIIGVRYQIFDGVWVNHSFHLLGPLLQDTQMNRANKVRAESMVLKSKIEKDMPSLTADLLPNQDRMGTTVLQGQVSTWILRLANTGSTAASQVTLKTNVPWINILDPNRTNRNDTATSFCVGPSGTLMKVPLALYRKDADDKILPGETVDIPVQVRTFGGGKQELYMLFRYELWTPPQNPTVKETPFRWLRKMITVGVFPSLTVTASLVPSYWEKDNHMLTIEISNLRTDRRSNLSIDLDKLYFVSRYYSVQQLEGQLGESEPLSSIAHEQALYGGSTTALEIGWQEKVSLHYLVTPLDEPRYTLSECEVMKKTKKFLNQQNSKIELNTLGNNNTTNFICLEHSHEKFMNVLLEHKKELARLQLENEKEGQPRHVAQIRRAKLALDEENENCLTPTDMDDMSLKNKQFHPTSIDNLCPPIDSDSKINVICSWSASNMPLNEVIYGQHHLRQLTVRPKETCKGCPLTITASYEQSITHDFSLGPLTLPLEINIRNRLIQSDVEFEFSVLCKQFEFELVGVENFRRTLIGGEELIVPLEAIIFASGIFDLQSLKLTVFTKDGDEVPYVFPLLQWNIKINVD